MKTLRYLFRFVSTRGIQGYAIAILALLLAGGCANPLSTALSDSKDTWTLRGLLLFPSQDRKADTPNISPEPGINVGTVVATISTTSDGAVIRYTTDGSDPTTSGTAVTGSSVSIDADMTIRAVAFGPGFMNSDIAEASYTIRGTIQEAIDASVDGGVINVSAGTYTAVDRALGIVHREVTIQGAGESPAEGTVCDGGAYGSGTDETGLGGINWPRAFVIQRDNVSIRNMRIRGYQGNTTTSRGYAIVARSLASWGVSEPTLDNLTIENVTFEDCYYGIRGQNTTAVTVQDTTYEQNSGESAYAVYINSSQGTHIRANDYHVGSIWITDATDAVIGGPDPSDGNVVTGARFNGIWYGQQFAAGTSSERGQIRHNIINGAGEGGIVVWNRPGETADAILILDNTIRNAAGGPDQHGGISIREGIFTTMEIRRNLSEQNIIAGLTIAGANIVSAAITHNDFITNDGHGVSINSSSSLGALLINMNNIQDNINYGIRNLRETTLNAEQNWWGDPSGPDDDAGVINGSGDRISTYVDADPWSIAPL